MATTTYVMHCKQCKRFVTKDDRNAGCDCPPATKSKWNPSRDGAPMVSFPDYKQDRNYPQVAPNLPGDGVVTSYADYKRKLKDAGQTEIGMSNESRYRLKHRKSKKRPKKLFYDMDLTTGQASVKKI